MVNPGGTAQTAHRDYAVVEQLPDHVVARVERPQRLGAVHAALGRPRGDPYADLAVGFDIGTTTVYRYLREALDLLAAMAPTLEQAIEVARGKAYVILDCSLLRIDRVGMTAKQDRPY